MRFIGPDSDPSGFPSRLISLAAGIVGLLLCSLDCHAGTIIAASHASLAPEFHHFAGAQVADSAAGPAACQTAESPSPAPVERPERLKSTRAVLLGDLDGASSPVSGTSSQAGSSFAAQGAATLPMGSLTAVYRHWREVSPNLAAGEKAEHLDPPRDATFST